METTTLLQDETDYIESELEKYKKAFNLLMGYWDNIPDEDKEKVHNALNRLGV